jgi:hypothetical protein
MTAMTDAPAAWRITNATKVAADGLWLAAVTIEIDRQDRTALHVAWIARDGRVWLPAALPASMRVAVAPAVAEAAQVLLAEGRS